MDGRTDSQSLVLTEFRTSVLILMKSCHVYSKWRSSLAAGKIERHAADFTTRSTVTVGTIQLRGVC